MISQLPPNKNKHKRYSKIALSVTSVVCSAVAAALFGAGNDFSLVFLVAAAASFATLLIIITADYAHIAAVFAAGLIAAGVLSRNMTAVIWSLAYMPVGWIIFHGLRKNALRTTIVVRIAVFLGVFYAVLVVGNLTMQHGEISPSIIFAAVDEQIEAAANMFQELIPINTNDPDAEAQAALAAEALAMNLRMMVPMIFAVYCLAIAYFATGLYRVLYNAVIGIRESRIIRRKDWRVHLSWVAALIMIVCSVVYLTVYDHHSASALLTAVITSNIRFILTPGFYVMGIYFLFDKVYGGYNRYREPKNRVVPSLMLFGACAFVFMFLQGAGIAILTVFGIYAALIGDIKKIYVKAKKLILDEGDDDNDNDKNNNSNEEER